MHKALIVLAVVVVSAVACSESAVIFEPPPASASGSGASSSGGSGPVGPVGPGGQGGSISAGGGGQGGAPTCASVALEHSHIGCEFWPTVTANLVWSIFDFAVAVTNAGATTANVTVTRGTTNVATAQVPAGNAAVIYLPWVAELKGPDTDACGSVVAPTASVRSDGGAYRLVSTEPVAVYQFSPIELEGVGGPPGKDWSSCPGPSCQLGCFAFSADGSVLLPQTTLGESFRVTGSAGWAAGNVGPFVAITGTQAGTNVSITLSASANILAGGGLVATPPNGTASFTLGAGDVVQIQASSNADLSGSVIQATHPVQVLAGAACMVMPDTAFACDHLEESVLPTAAFGTRYFVVPPTGPNGDTPGHVVRFYGNTNGTTLTYPSTTPPGAPTSLDAGEVVDMGVVTQSFEVVGSQPFAVSSFMLGGELLDPLGMLLQKGDPAQTAVAAVDQYVEELLFFAPLGYEVSYLDVVRPLAASVTLDGNTLGAPIAIGPEFGVNRVLLARSASGAHRLQSDAPVGMQVMGYGPYTSYMHPGGFDLP